MALLHCELESKSLRMTTSLHVILPHDTHSGSRPVKTLYLLHGRSHNDSVWTRYTRLEQYASAYNAAIIMPGVNRSFYCDMKYGVEYQTYLAKELPDLCESMFHISPDPQDRYIAGMSMGGYGALKTALLNPGRYGACGAISAVTDIRKHLLETPDDTPKKREFQGIFGENCQLSPEDDIFQLADQKKNHPLKPAFYLACGIQDHLYEETTHLTQVLTTLGYQIHCEEWDGSHDWNFWDEALKRMLAQFFSVE